jgi:aromatic ring-cleaving dioxygenase
MKHYHAHIYFQFANQETQDLIDKAMLLHSQIFTVYKVHPKKVGPHFLPMIELHFMESNKAEVLAWLNMHRKDFSVLVHEDTGDDIQDHLSPIWLGEKLPIDFNFFEKVKRDASLSVH